MPVAKQLTLVYSIAEPWRMYKHCFFQIASFSTCKAYIVFKAICITWHIACQASQKPKCVFKLRVGLYAIKSRLLKLISIYIWWLCSSWSVLVVFTKIVCNRMLDKLQYILLHEQIAHLVFLISTNREKETFLNIITHSLLFSFKVALNSTSHQSITSQRNKGLSCHAVHM